MFDYQLYYYQFICYIELINQDFANDKVLIILLKINSEESLIVRSKEKQKALNNYSFNKKQFISKLYTFFFRKKIRIKYNYQEEQIKYNIGLEDNRKPINCFKSEQISEKYFTQLKELKNNQEKSEIISQNPNKVSKQISKPKKAVSQTNSESNSPQKQQPKYFQQSLNTSSNISVKKQKIDYQKGQFKFTAREEQQCELQNTSDYLEEEQESKSSSEVVVVGGGVNNQSNIEIEIQNSNIRESSKESSNSFFQNNQVSSQIQGFVDNISTLATSTANINNFSQIPYNNSGYISTNIIQEQQIQQIAYQSQKTQGEYLQINNSFNTQFNQNIQILTDIQNMDEHHNQQMIDENGHGNNKQQQNQDSKEGTPVFSSDQSSSVQESFPQNSQALNNASSEDKNNQSNNGNYLKQKSNNSNTSNNKGGFFQFQTNEQVKEDEELNSCVNNYSEKSLSLNVNQSTFKDPSQPKENIPINIIQPQQQLPKKKVFNLSLPVDIISKAEKEIPLLTDNNSQKKKQNVFNFYDNFHEYTVFCDVAMKKCSRENQEDRFQAKNPLDEQANNDAFFAVFDGHGTSAIADIVKENLHEYIVKNENYPKNIEKATYESFKKIDEEILKKQQDQQICSGGTTALCSLIKENQLYIINCGDSSSVLVTNDYNVKVLNKLHKPSSKDEQLRLTQKKVIFTEQRVVGSLAVTRALGDLKHKEYIISEPEIALYEIDENSKYLFLGTDGFWDIVNYQTDLPDLLRKRQSLFEGQEESLKDLSTYLVENASSRKTSQKKDNMTLLAIDLNWYYRQNLETKESVSDTMLGSKSVMCSKSQYKINTEISSYLFQVKSPHSVGRSIDRKYGINSQSSSKQEYNDAKTCSKNFKKKAFFGSENSEEETNKNDELKSLDNILFQQKETLQVPTNQMRNNVQTFFENSRINDSEDKMTMSFGYELNSSDKIQQDSTSTQNNNNNNSNNNGNIQQLFTNLPESSENQINLINDKKKQFFQF